MELSRAWLRPGAEAETERWMAMLHDRYEECVATLASERMAFEATFRHRDGDGDEWLYHVSVFGEGGAIMDGSHDVDREHIAFAKRCKEPGWEEMRPVLFLAPPPVRTAMEQWAGQSVGEHPESPEIRN